MRRFMTAAAAVLVVLGLTGCFPPLPQPTTTTVDGPVADAPEGWAEFPHCEGGPDEDWVWVDDFPSAAFEASELRPVCGDTWVRPDGETFLGVAHYGLTVEDLDRFGGALEAEGYVALWDDFDPTVARDSAGARDYYLDGVGEGDFTRLAVEVYANGDGSYTAYFDHLSPLTRDLTP